MYPPRLLGMCLLPQPHPPSLQPLVILGAQAVGRGPVAQKADGKVATANAQQDLGNAIGNAVLRQLVMGFAAQVVAPE